MSWRKLLDEWRMLRAERHLSRAVDLAGKVESAESTVIVAGVAKIIETVLRMRGEIK